MRGQYPTMPADHTHARALLDNAMRYVAPANGMVDKVSGYPFEGWNRDPARGLFLRSFTQLTAIGQYLELLADVVAGQADSPDLPADSAEKHLARLVATLRRDQHDPTLSARGLLVNFLDLESGKRLSPLASDVQKAALTSAFGAEKAEALWKALKAKGWITPRNKDQDAEIKRIEKFGYEGFDGPLSPFRDDATRQKVMAILDQRVVLVVFGDNANLSTSVAKAIGALLTPGVAERADVAAIRRELEAFLDDQKEGYARLYDPGIGLFYFGFDSSKGRYFGWDDAQGNWTTGHQDYFVNEFRGPATFIAVRFGIPGDAIGNLGFKIKPYATREGKTLYALAPWEGSAFQAMGLGLSLLEESRPSWRALLGNVVAIETDYSRRNGLPGFLSESYTGVGVQYTGAVGIPEITVSPRPRITDAASLYTLGVASTIDRGAVESFLSENWPVITSLFTDHGPWEGYNIALREPIRFQTTAHTLSLILGLIGTGPSNMRRYVDHAGLAPALEAQFRPGGPRRPARQGDQGLCMVEQGRPDPRGARGSFVPRRGAAHQPAGDRLRPAGQGRREPLRLPGARPLSIGAGDRAGHDRAEARRGRARLGPDLQGDRHAVHRHRRARGGDRRHAAGDGRPVADQGSGDRPREGRILADNRPHGDPFRLRRPPVGSAMRAISRRRPYRRRSVDPRRVPPEPFQDGQRLLDVPRRAELRREGVADDPLAVDHEGGPARDQAERLRDAVERPD